MAQHKNRAGIPRIVWIIGAVVGMIVVCGVCFIIAFALSIQAAFILNDADQRAQNTGPPTRALSGIDGQGFLHCREDDPATRITFVEGYALVATWEHDRQHIVDLAWAPDSPNILIGTEFDVYLYCPFDDAWVELQADDEALFGSVYGVDWSPDGAAFAAAIHTDILHWQRSDMNYTLVESLHGQPITTITYSPDGRYLATGAWSDDVVLSDAAILTRERHIEAHTDWVFDIAFLPDSTGLISASADKTARLWLLDEDDPAQEFLDHEDRITSVAVSSDGALLYTGSWDETVRVWSLDTGEPVGAPLGVPTQVTALGLSPDDRRLAVGLVDGQILILDTSTNDLEFEIDRHTTEITVLEWASNGLWLASGSVDQFLYVWEFDAD